MVDSTLPPSILELIRSHFAEHDHEQAIDMVSAHRKSVSWLKCAEQAQRDLVLAAHGEVSELVRLSRMDYRDIIMEAEYMLRGGKIVRRDPPLE